MFKKPVVRALLIIVIALAFVAIGALATIAGINTGIIPYQTHPSEPEEVKATPEPTPTPNYDGPLYVVTYDNTPCNDEPAFPSGDMVSYLSEGVTAREINQEGDFIQLYFGDDRTAWVHGWYLDAEDEAEQTTRELTWLNRLKSADGYTPIENLFSAKDYTFHCTVDSLYVRPATNTADVPLSSISAGEEVMVLGYTDGYYLCQLSNGKYGYCAAQGLESNASYVELDGAVDLRYFMPELEFDLLFASPNNIVGEAMYPAIPLMEANTASMLKQAEDLFLADGYTIKVYDAYRPKTAQYRLYDIVKDNRFIANPYNGNSYHNLGRAIDMSLVNVETGEELEMPTPMHTFDVSASRSNSYQWTETARANVEYMTKVMTSVGFKLLATEWWHFENTAKGNYMNTNINYDALTYHHLSDLVDAEVPS